MSDFMDRDYDTEFSITLEWGEWNKIYSLIHHGMERKQDQEWPDEEYQRDSELRKKFTLLVGENSPGNGMDDWPDSMKEAYDETVAEMMREELDDE